MIVFSVFDSKAERYLAPFFSQTEASATRALTHVMMDPNHEFFRFAEDYSLFRIGYWDDEAGALSPNAPTVIVGCWVLKAALKNTGENGGA